MEERESRQQMMKPRRGIGVAGFVMIAAVALGALCPWAFGQTSSTAEIKIDNFSFGPATITVAAGTTVTWINRDDIPHKVVSNDDVFRSNVLDTDGKFSYTFSKAGAYPYFCSLHPKMTGQIVVH
jgi:plastocyanin